MKAASSLTGAGVTLRSFRRLSMSWSMRAANSLSLSAAACFAGSAAREVVSALRQTRHTANRTDHRCKGLLMKGSLREDTARRFEAVKSQYRRCDHRTQRL